MDFLDEEMASPHGCYFDAIPKPDEVRKQNPQMHLSERFIAFYQATEDARYLAYSEEIFSVFRMLFSNRTVAGFANT